MGRDSELIRLESYVERLLGEFSNLRAEKHRLERELQELKDQNNRLAQELQELKDQNNRLTQELNMVDGERTDVCVRVTSLIERLEHWESELESDNPADETSTSHASAEGNSTGEEDPTTVQKNLFSA